MFDITLSSSSYELSKQVYIFLQSVVSVPYFYLYAVESLVYCLFRLQEAILTTPHRITRLMDMLMYREVTVSAVGHEDHIHFVCFFLLRMSLPQHL